MTVSDASSEHKSMREGMRRKKYCRLCEWWLRTLTRFKYTESICQNVLDLFNCRNGTAII